MKKKLILTNISSVCTFSYCFFAFIESHPPLHRRLPQPHCKATDLLCLTCVLYGRCSESSTTRVMLKFVPYMGREYHEDRCLSFLHKMGAGVGRTNFFWCRFCAQSMSKAARISSPFIWMTQTFLTQIWNPRRGEKNGPVNSCYRFCAGHLRRGLAPLK